MSTDRSRAPAKTVVSNNVLSVTVFCDAQYLVGSLLTLNCRRCLTGAGLVQQRVHQDAIAEEYERFECTTPDALSEREVAKIEALATNLPEVWNASGTSAIATAMHLMTGTHLIRLPSTFLPGRLPSRPRLPEVACLAERDYQMNTK